MLHEIKPLNEVIEEVKASESKKRRAPLKSQKTGADIVKEIEELQSQVTEFETALDEVDPHSVAYPIVKAAHDEKAAELKALLNKIHFS